MDSSRGAPPVPIPTQKSARFPADVGRLRVHALQVYLDETREALGGLLRSEGF
jgi:hypothetical protein